MGCDLLQCYNKCLSEECQVGKGSVQLTFITVWGEWHKSFPGMFPGEEARDSQATLQNIFLGQQGASMKTSPHCPSPPHSFEKNHEKALQLFEEMEQRHVQLNNVTFNAAISACANGGKWEKARLDVTGRKMR